VSQRGDCEEGNSDGVLPSGKQRTSKENQAPRNRTRKLSKDRVTKTIRRVGRRQYEARDMSSGEGSCEDTETAKGAKHELVLRGGWPTDAGMGPLQRKVEVARKE